MTIREFAGRGCEIRTVLVCSIKDMSDRQSWLETWVEVSKLMTIRGGIRGPLSRVKFVRELPETPYNHRPLNSLNPCQKKNKKQLKE